MTADESDFEDCAFCNIAHGRDEAAEIVCDGKDWIAFFPLNPATLGHTLVIPRRHVTDLWHAQASLADGLIRAVIRVGQAITEALEPEGMNLITSAGQTAEQTVFHLHLHIVPRWRDDGFGRIWPMRELPMRADLDEVAGRIRLACVDGSKS
jgi:histidine triad (HIT) family protein